MRAVVCKRLGKPLESVQSGDLRLDLDWERPTCGARGVRIAIVSAGVNFADYLVVQGLYQERPPLPFIPGAEVFGVVIDVGAKVRRVAKGDKVVAVTFTGGFSEECVVDEGAVFKVHGEGEEFLAGLPIAYGTAHMSLVHRANLKPGEKILISGAAGGVGLAAVQIAKIIGASVIAVARGENKAKILREAGADVVVDAGAFNDVKSLGTALKKASSGGVHVVLDVVGGMFFDASLKCTQWGTRVLIVGFASGQIPKVPTNIALVKNLAVHGVYWGAHFYNDPQVLHDSMSELLSWISQGKLAVHVSHRFPLEHFDRALMTVANRKAVGKVIIVNKGYPRL